MNWIWQIAVKKGLQRIIQLLVAWLTAHGLANWGITINQDQLIISVFGALEVARNFLKVKYGVKWL